MDGKSTCSRFNCQAEDGKKMDENNKNYKIIITIWKAMREMVSNGLYNQ